MSAVSPNQASHGIAVPSKPCSHARVQDYRSGNIGPGVVWGDGLEGVGIGDVGSGRWVLGITTSGKPRDRWVVVWGRRRLVCC